MQQSLAMIMLPVSDLTRSRTFYEQGLGWEPRGGKQSRYSVKYVTAGALVTMIDRAYLMAESGLPHGPASLGTVLVVNVASTEEVDAVAAAVVAAGGTITSPARVRDGGLYTFYFIDPDRNSWEVVWSPAPAVPAK